MPHDIRKWAAVLRGLTIAVMVLLPLAVVFALISTPLTPANVPQAINRPDVADAATRGQLLTVTALNLIRPLILIWTLNEMRKLFDEYRVGRVLTDACARIIQRVGYGFLALALIPLVLQPVQSVLMTWANPAGQRAISLSVNSDMLFFALSGGLIIVIGRAMRDAAEAAAENRSFV